MIMRTAIDKEDFERKEKGLKVRRKPKKVMPDPDQPEVKGQIRIDQVPIGEVAGFFSTPKNVTNKDGVRFIGHEVTINVKDKKPISGWMAEGDVIRLRQLTGRVR